MIGKLKNKLKGKVLKKIIALVIAATLGYLGFSGELAKQFAEEGAEIIVEEVVE